MGRQGISAFKRRVWRRGVTMTSVTMTTGERVHEIVRAVLDACGVELVDKRAQVEAIVADHVAEIERLAAEKAVGVYREKAKEASEKVLSPTAIGSPTS
jgi:NAD(P)H-hydrate repair Nnr-like enzyme with NAD(P)H-hydrate dehydratase domain